MQTTKHMTDSAFGDAQEVFETSIARLEHNGTVLPVVATSEAEWITVFVWDDASGKWRGERIRHAPIEAGRGTPSISNTWNWSRRVGLTTADGLIYVVYKRSPMVGDDEEPLPAVLTLAILEIDDGKPRLKQDPIPVPMPKYRRVDPGPPLRFDIVAETPGFELWVGMETRRRQLLIVTQTLGENATDSGGGAMLKLFSCELDQIDQPEAWTYRDLDRGGYGLDARMVEGELLLAYRTLPQAVNLPLLGFDPESGFPRMELDASSESDRFFTPLKIMQLVPGSLETVRLELPGGEHPRIQSVSPLLIVVDRPKVTIRYRLRTGSIDPLIDWDIQGTDKLALMLDDTERLARGVLLSIPEDGAPPFPRTAWPWVDVQDLFTDITAPGFGWASTWARLPLEALRLGEDKKGLFLDFLHKSPWFALLRSRARLSADFDNRSLTILELNSLVYDINHAQMVAPDTLLPDASGENDQFAPFELLSQNSGPSFLARAYQPDNTIGGSLVSDREGTPYRFLAYTDLGDGGLRVIYDEELEPPGEPPLNEEPKKLEPGMVPGPGSAGERWIELQATDWQATDLPKIEFRSVFNMEDTIISSVHAQTETLIRAEMDWFHGSRDPILELSRDEVNSIQSRQNSELGAILGSVIVEANDGILPTASIRFWPAALNAEADTFWEADLEGEPVIDVQWEFHLLDPNGNIVTLPLPVARAAAGNPATVQLPQAGDWRVLVRIVRADGSLRQFQVEIRTQESLFSRITALHRGLSGGTPEPPFESIGTVRMGTMNTSLLQYRLTFQVEPEALFTQSVIIDTLETTHAQWRFLANEAEQGLIAYRLGLEFDSQDIRLRGPMSGLLKVESVQASAFYARTFTPGILMNDTRSVSPLTNGGFPADALRRLTQSSSDRLSSALTARPFGNARVTVENVDVKVSMLPLAAVAGVIALLLGLAAVGPATVLAAMLLAFGAASAAAGLVAAALALGLALAIFLFIAFVVPPIVEDRIERTIRERLEGQETLDDLARMRLMQFAGEGAAEAIARQVIENAGLTLDPATPVGENRFRKDLFQMIHVSEGRCRVLIRG